MTIQTIFDAAPALHGSRSQTQEASEKASTPGCSPMDWGSLLSQIRAGDESAIERLYHLFSRGLRYYLCRTLGPQESEDKAHDTFLVVLKAIRRGDIREPDCLVSFVRTIVRRQAAAYIEQAGRDRREQTDLGTGFTVPDRKQNPEQEAMARQRAEVMKNALSALSDRDREILVRFYVKEQPPEQICREMKLTKTQFRLHKSSAKEKFGKIGKKKLGRGVF